MKPPKCRLCSHEHWLSEPHVFATNKKDATNRVSGDVRKMDVVAPPVPMQKASEKVERPPVEKGGEGCVGAGKLAKTANGRNRADYNAYQRDLMRRRRAEAKQRAA